MRDDWILDVLADLGSFAEQNDLPALAGRLADTRKLAALELEMRTTAGSAEVLEAPALIYRQRGGGPDGLDS